MEERAKKVINWEVFSAKIAKCQQAARERQKGGQAGSLV